MAIIKVKYKKYGGKECYISDTEFDPSIMVKLEISEDEKKQGEANIADIINSGSAPGIISSNSEPSLTFNNKLDEGAVGNLLDVGIDKAKKRADERNKKLGHSFKKVKTRYRRRKH